MGRSVPQLVPTEIPTFSLRLAGFIPSSKSLMIFKWCISDKGRILHLKLTEVLSVFLIYRLFQDEVTLNPPTPKKTSRNIPNASDFSEFSRVHPLELALCILFISSFSSRVYGSSPDTVWECGCLGCLCLSPAVGKEALKKNVEKIMILSPRKCPKIEFW